MSLVIVCQILVPHKIYSPRTTKNYIFNHTTNQNKFQVKSLERKLCDSHSNKHDEADMYFTYFAFINRYCRCFLWWPVWWGYNWLLRGTSFKVFDMIDIICITHRTKYEKCLCWSNCRKYQLKIIYLSQRFRFLFFKYRGIRGFYNVCVMSETPNKWFVYFFAVELQDAVWDALETAPPKGLGKL